MLLLNYRPVLRQPTGIGVYANAILSELRHLPHLLIPGGEKETGQHRLKRVVWTQFRLPRLAMQHKASLIFTPAPEGYLGPQSIPQVVMVHDLRPISHPELSMQSLYFRNWVPLLLRSCHHIVTNSHFTAREIQRCTGVAEGKISIIPLGFDSAVFRPSPPPSSAWSEPYLLHVGQAYPHKNLQRLIEAFASISARHPQLRLVLAGKPYASEIQRLKALVLSLGLEKRVEFRAYVPFADLPDLYRGALALVYPSLWEGFGLPVLEAMACGTPVITSRGSGTEEVAGDAALLINPQETGSLCEAITDLLADPNLRQQLRQRGLSRARQFSWTSTGSKTAELLYRLAP